MNIRYNLAGMFLPINPANNKPVFLTICGKFLLPIFTTEDKLKVAAEWGNFTFAIPKSILDPVDFTNSVLNFKKNLAFHVVVDPYINEKGNTEFQMIPFDEEERKLGEI